MPYASWGQWWCCSGITNRLCGSQVKTMHHLNCNRAPPYWSAVPSHCRCALCWFWATRCHWRWVGLRSAPFTKLCCLWLLLDLTFSILYKAQITLVQTFNSYIRLHCPLLYTQCDRPLESACVFGIWQVVRKQLRSVIRKEDPQDPFLAQNPYSCLFQLVTDYLEPCCHQLQHGYLLQVRHYILPRVLSSVSIGDILLHRVL